MTIKELHECKAQPAPVQQEPVGAVYRCDTRSSISSFDGIRWTSLGLKLPDGALLYTSPPAQRTWVGLTDEEILTVARDHYNPHQRPEISFSRAIEAKLKEKNT